MAATPAHPLEEAPLDAAYNAAGLTNDIGHHVVTQARWAVKVARAALLKLASDPPSTDRLGATIQRVYRLAGSRVGKQLWLVHGVDLRDAIDVTRLREMSALHGKQLDLIQRAIDRRRTLAVT